MAATKTSTVHQNNVTLTAAAGDTTSTAADISASYGAILTIKLTNGATGPTIAAQVIVEISHDNSIFYQLAGPLVGSTANNGVVSWSLRIPVEAKFVRTVSGSNTGQNVTLRSEITEVSALS